MKKAVFLDRDGTLNYDEHGYISNYEDFHLFPFTADAIAELNKLGFLVFIVTNQSGIARGYYTEKDVKMMHEKMEDELHKKGAKIDGIFYSPYHKDGTVAPFGIAHEDRKPGLGMLKKAKQDFEFVVRDSYMIGDKYTDIRFGKNAGMKTILVLTGLGNKEFMENRNNWEQKPDFIVKDLWNAVMLIKKIESKK